MKALMLTLFISFIAIAAKAQFTNTKWKVTLYTPDPSEVVFDFRTDTVEAFSADDNESLETMVYTVQDSILTLKKITGQSECDDTPGKYKFQMKDDGMYLTLIEDACTHRAGLLNNQEKWMKTQ